MKQLDLFGKLPPGGRKPAGPVLADEEHRRVVREDLDRSLFVEAAAGTGKTSELVRRIIAVLHSGRTTLGRMVALTFTDKAAGELKLRLREEIERERQRGAGPGTQGRLDEALRELEAAQIGTIHSFCAELLRERPVEAGVDPLFETSDEEAAQQLLDDAFEGWFQRVLAAPPEGVRRVLRRRYRGRDEEGPREQLRRAVASLAEHRDFPAPWRRPELDRQGAIDGLMERLSGLAELAGRAQYPDDYLARSFSELARQLEEQRALEASGGRDYDGLEAWLRGLLRQRLWNWKGRHRLTEFAPGLARDEVLSRRQEVRDAVEQVLAVADADVAALLQGELQPVIEEYERLKTRKGTLDFLDLLLKSRNLVRDDDEVRRTLQRRFTHFFVDEFQDTDPLQVEILLLLAADDPAERDWTRARTVAGKLFLVGDPKQSIYRFRRADVALYESVKKRLCADGARVVPLESSFRSVPSIQQAINAAFAPAMTADESLGQPGYVPLRAVRPEADRPTVVALPVPRPYSTFGWSPSITLARIGESYPDAVGAFVAWLVRESGWEVSERERPGRAVAVEPRHICLLFRRFSSFGDDLTRPYVRALEARRIPHVVVGGRSFHSREEIEALRNALVAIEWPDDELSVYATLRGPLFSLTDDQLLAYRQRTGRFHPLQKVDASQLAGPEREVADALSVLGELHPRRNRRAVSETIVRLLSRVRAHANLAMWPTAEQALANMLQLVDLSRRLEASGASSFRAIVERLEQAAERGAAQEAPVVEEGTEGVRMMTVHKAKGLEFPVVILVDPTARLRRSSPSRHVDPVRRLWAEPLAGCCPVDLTEQAELELARDEHEEIRLAYVAATRARDLLVVPTLGDPADLRPCWLDVLAPAVYPPRERRREPEVAPGCPPFGGETVLDRPVRADAPPESSVVPGLHAPSAGEHRVVWWDPAALALDVDRQFGVRQQQLLEPALVGAEAVEAARREYERWRARRERTLSSGAEPLYVVESVTGIAKGSEPEKKKKEKKQLAPPVELCDAAAPRTRAGRPAGKRFGNLVHATLAAVPLEGDRAQVESASRVQGRVVGAPPAEVEACVEVVLAALAHPLMQRAARSTDLRRETPVLFQPSGYLGREGGLIEGIADLVFLDPEGEGGPTWVVVDFKTDLELGERLEEYRAQVRLYMEAVRRATGGEVRGALLWV
jgi:ATP-dependent exoDNAse (exonuclease V) beta subunit